MIETINDNNAIKSLILFSHPTPHAAKPKKACTISRGVRAEWEALEWKGKIAGAIQGKKGGWVAAAGGVRIHPNPMHHCHQIHHLQQPLHPPAAHFHPTYVSEFFAVH